MHGIVTLSLAGVLMSHLNSFSQYMNSIPVTLKAYMGSVASIHMVVNALCDTTPRRSDALFKL